MTIKNILMAVTTMFLFAASAHAVAQTDTGELSVGGGFTSYNDDGQSTNNGHVDASASVNPFPNFAIGFEYSYSPIASVNVSGDGVSASGSVSLQTYGGVIRYGLLHEARLRPYMLIAGGGAHVRATATASGDGETYSATNTVSGGYFGLGGGVNARIGNGFGVRPEVRYERVSIAGSVLNEIVFTGSLYYTFGDHHKDVYVRRKP
jgi:hypothetical protein